jgi:acyl-CoA thioesterase
MTDYLAAVQRAAKLNPFWRFLGIEAVDAQEGIARLRLQVREEISNGRGARVHGGVYPALVDAAVGAALMTLNPDPSTPRMAATSDLNVSLLRGVSDGWLHVEARVLKRGRTVGFGEATITDDDGQVVAVGRATYVFARRDE